MMKWQERTTAWANAGIITPEQGEKIIHFEREQPAASWFLWGLSGLGISVLMTGVISIIAANWDLLSAQLKLVFYFISLFILGVFVIKQSKEAPLVFQVLINAFILFLLAGIGLISQTYHLTGEPYGALFFWLALSLPLALFAQNRLTHNLWFAGLAGGILLWLLESQGGSQRMDRLHLAIAIPYILLGLGYLFGHKAERFFTGARIWSFQTILLLFVPFANFAWANGQTNDSSSQTAAHCVVVIAALLFAMIGVAGRQIQKGRVQTVALVTTLLITSFMVFVPLFGIKVESPLAGSLLFIASWSGAAVVAALNQRRRLFDLAALVIGMRFVFLYFEVFGSLAATGIGLIFSGVVILATAYVWHRYRSTVVHAIQGAA